MSIKNILELCTSLEVSYYYAEKTKYKIICYDIEKYNSFIYDGKFNIWKFIGLNETTHLISNEINKFIRAEQLPITEETVFKKAKTLFNKCGNHNFIKEVTKNFLSEKYDNEFKNKLDKNPYHINFLNGVYDCKTETFRQRRYDDYVSNILDYDYVNNVSAETEDKLNEILFKICNRDQKIMDSVLLWFAYNLIGITKEQKMANCIGYTASNGKSTLHKLFSSAFNIYVHKLDSRTFETDYSTKRHKQFTILKDKPIRMAYIEEITEKHLDISLLKDFVDGHSINNEIMFGTSEEIPIGCKLTIFGNQDPTFITDEGIKRRGMTFYFNSRFLEGSDYEKYKDKENVFKKDKSLSKWMELTEVKQALFLLMKEYIADYINYGFKKMDKKPLDNFKELAEDNDKTLEFVENNIEITNDSNDRINKNEMYEAFKFEVNKYASIRKCITELKRHEINYCKDLRNKDGSKGCFIGIKWKSENKEECKKNLFI